MDWGTVRVCGIPPRFGERAVDDLVGLFAGIPLGEEEPGAFGALDVRMGWVGHAGPGFVLRTTLSVRVDPELHTLELRLRANGRYVRSRVRAYADRHRDFTLTLPATPVVTAFIPYAALPPAVEALTVELWLVEDGDPIEEAYWPLRLPPYEARRLENALTAVVLAAASTIEAPSEGGVVASGPLEEAVAELFQLDALGRRWASEIVADAQAESALDVVERLRAWVAEREITRVLALIRPFARTARARSFLTLLTGLLDTQPSKPPPRKKGPATHYDTLGVPPTATREEVRAAYLKAAALHHPDHVPEARRAEATEAMKKVNAAWAALRRR